MKETLNIFETLRKDNVIPLRGLTQMAEIMQTAYDLFLDDFFVSEIGEPFSKIADKPLYKTFNRATIEETLNQTRLYGEVKFDGTYLTVSSQGIEECLEGIEVIWLATQGMKSNEAEGTANFGNEIRLFKYNAMGRLATILIYLLQTCQNLIATTRVRQLNERILITSEPGRKPYLLRYKTDLLKNKHGIKSVHTELIRVIDLELDLLKQLESPSSHKVISDKEPAEGETTLLPVSIETDLNYEMSIFSFPFKKALKNDLLSFERLKYEFSLLPPEPKRHWYFNDFINAKQWEAHCTSKFTPSEHSELYINTEQLANQLIREFSRMVLDKTVDPKYYGRHLKDTKIVATLHKIDLKLNDLIEYVKLNNKVEGYETYARVAGKSILDDVYQLPGQSLQLLILNEIVSQSLENDFALQMKLIGLQKREPENTQILSRYKILKLYINDNFSAARESIIKSELILQNKTVKKTTAINGSGLPSKISLFRDDTKTTQYLSLLQTSKPPIIDRTGHYILGSRKKGAVTAWFDALLNAGKINSELSWDLKTALVNELIPGLNVTKETLQKSLSVSYQTYAQPFLDSMSDI